MEYNMHAKDRLKKVFLEQLEEKDIDQITVTSLCKEIDINRSTFYRYYCDVYDLLEDIQNDFLEQTQQLSDRIICSDLSPTEVVVYILEYISEHKNLLTVLLLKKQDERFMNQINELVVQLFRKKVLQIFTDYGAVPQEDFEDILLFLTAGFYSIYKKWLIAGCKEDAQKIAVMTTSLSLFCVRGFMKMVQNDKG